jgi:SecD/SecF fusion protein
MLCVITLLAAGFILVSLLGVGSGKTLSAGNIRQGLDLRGGVSIVYEADADNPTNDQMDAAVSLMRGRLDLLGYTEAPVSREGAKRIAVDIPGVEDAEEAVDIIGRTALVRFLGPAEGGGHGEELFDGSHIDNAYHGVVPDTAGVPQSVVMLEFDDYATELFADATSRFMGQPIYIMLDDEELSAPTVQTVIYEGECYIEGGFTSETATQLAALIRAGSLPFGLNELSVINVGAQLGENALNTSLIAGAIGLACVLIFMFVIYRWAGLAADLALIVYMGLMLLILSAFRLTLTLPGIAGIVLSIGMAVDANVIIFERLKEELSSGRRSFRSSLDMSFKRAFSAILDGNVTTMVSAVILYILGSGPVKGFAVTLGIGIILSMFTCLVVTRLILKSFVGVGINKAGQYNVKQGEALKERELHIAEKRRLHFMIPSGLIALGLIFMLIFGVTGNGMFNYDVEFAGGTRMRVDLQTNDFNNADVERIFADVTGQTPRVQRVTGTNEVMVSMRRVEPETRQAIEDALIAQYPGINRQGMEVVDVSATVSGEMQRTALIAVAAALAAMFIYVAFRFRDARIGGSTIIGLLVNVLVLFAVYAAARVPLNETFIIVILTILGYSVNSTIVMFDRLRENRKLQTRMDNNELIDASASQSLKRALYTSLTTLFPIVCMLILGVSSIRDFALPIMLGVVFGTYSSLWFAGSVWHVWVSRKAKA